MKLTNFQKLFAASALNNVVLITRIIVGLFLMPFIIKHIGDRQYGIWVLVNAFMGYLGFDLGLSSAISRYISQAEGRKDSEKINRVFNSGLVLFTCSGCLIFFIVIIIAHLPHLFFSSLAEQKLFSMVMFVLGLNIAIDFPFRTLVGFFRAKLRFDLINITELGKIITKALLIYQFISSGFGLLSLVVITFMVNILEHLIHLILLTIYYKEIKFVSFNYFTRNQIIELFHYAKFSFISEVANVLRFRIDEFVITSFLGLSLVTHYYIAAKLVDCFMQCVGKTVHVIKPYFSALEGAGNIKQLEKSFLFSLKVSVFISFLLGGGLLVFGKPFIAIWMGSNYLDAVRPLYILTVAFAFALAQSPFIGILYSTSNHKFLSYTNLLEGFLNLLLSIILIKRYGLIGVALGTAIPLIFSKSAVIPLLLNKFIVNKNKMKINIYIFLSSLLFKGLLITIITYLTLFKFITHGIKNLLSMSSLFIIIFSLIAIFLLFNASERTQLKKAISI